MAESPIYLSLEDIKKEYPVHLFVWNNEFEELKKHLETNISNVSTMQKMFVYFVIL